MLLNILRLKTKKTSQKINLNEKSAKESLLEAGRILKDRRIEYGISRNDLAIKTRITTPVLEAIENGWINKIPEGAYLSSMLNILEMELNLKKDSLNGTFNKKKDSLEKKSIKTFNPENIDIFGTWKGCVIYMVLIFCSIIGLNHQQRNLARLNSQTFNPIVPNIENATQIVNKENSEEVSSPIKNQHHLSLFKSLFNIFKSQNELGLLELNLKSPRVLSIESKGNYKASINKASGKMKMKLPFPLTIEINPLPDNDDEVRWEGKLYKLEDMKNGVYVFNQESNKLTSPENDLPQ